MVADESPSIIQYWKGQSPEQIEYFYLESEVQLRRHLYSFDGNLKYKSFAHSTVNSKLHPTMSNRSCIMLEVINLLKPTFIPIPCNETFSSGLHL